MAPLCLLAYTGIRRRARWTPAVEIAVSSIQIMGTIMFVAEELLKGLPNQYPGRGLDVDSITYFYFAFVFCNPIWIAVPVTLIVNAAKAIAGTKSKQA